MNRRRLLALCFVTTAFWVVGFAAVAHASTSPGAVFVDAHGATFVESTVDAGVSTLVAAPEKADPVPSAPVAPEVKLGAAAGLVLVVVKLLIEIAKSAAVGSVWGKMSPLVKLIALGVLGACAAFLTSYTSGQGLWASLGAAFLGIMGAVQHGDDMAPARGSAV